MKDFNFFSAYLLEKRNKRLKKLYIISVSSLIIIGLLSFTALNIYQINKFKSDISMVENYLNSERTKELLDRYEETKKRTEIVNKYYNKMTEVDRIFNEQNTINTSLLTKLSGAMPQDSFVLSMKISNGDLELRYAVPDLVPVAEIAHNLRALNIFETVHVSLMESETNYTAIINCSLKDVNVE